ncbi:hypothetical protein DRO61_10305 [Candidatus Bathyarchaeota archaeon]|nr:MAG: hypothetical protein DRO61_10305 [Candidatus Bathyarchaeota archaeon]
MVYLFINDAGKIVHHHDWEDHWDDSFEVIEEEMTEREAMIYNSGISYGLWLANTEAIHKHRVKLVEERHMKKKNKECGWLWLNDGVQDIADVLDNLYYNETDHFVNGNDDRLV